MRVLPFSPLPSETSPLPALPWAHAKEAQERASTGAFPRDFAVGHGALPWEEGAVPMQGGWGFGGPLGGADDWQALDGLSSGRALGPRIEPLVATPNAKNLEATKSLNKTPKRNVLELLGATGAERREMGKELSLAEPLGGGPGRKGAGVDAAESDEAEPEKLRTPSKKDDKNEDKKLDAAKGKSGKKGKNLAAEDPFEGPVALGPWQALGGGVWGAMPVVGAEALTGQMGGSLAREAVPPTQPKALVALENPFRKEAQALDDAPVLFPARPLWGEDWTGLSAPLPQHLQGAGFPGGGMGREAGPLVQVPIPLLGRESVHADPAPLLAEGFGGIPLLNRLEELWGSPDVGLEWHPPKGGGEVPVWVAAFGKTPEASEGAPRPWAVPLAPRALEDDASRQLFSAWQPEAGGSLVARAAEQVQGSPRVAWEERVRTAAAALPPEASPARVVGDGVQPLPAQPKELWASGMERSLLGMGQRQTPALFESPLEGSLSGGGLRLERGQTATGTDALAVGARSGPEKMAWSGAPLGGQSGGGASFGGSSQGGGREGLGGGEPRGGGAWAAGQEVMGMERVSESSLETPVSNIGSPITEAPKMGLAIDESDDSHLENRQEQGAFAKALLKKVEKAGALLAGKSLGEAKVSINDGHMGHVELKIFSGKDSRIWVQIEAQNPGVLDDVRRSLPALKESLEKHHLSVGGLQVAEWNAPNTRDAVVFGGGSAGVGGQGPQSGQGGGNGGRQPAPPEPLDSRPGSRLGSLKTSPPSASPARLSRFEVQTVSRKGNGVHVKA